MPKPKKCHFCDKPAKWKLGQFPIVNGCEEHKNALQACRPKEPVKEVAHV